MTSRRLALGRIDNATAKRLLAQYMPIVRALRALYKYTDASDYHATGEDAILEGYLTYEPGTASEATWIRQTIHWRLTDLAIQAARARAMHGEYLGTDPQVVNGANPEQQFWRATAVRAIAKLTLRQQNVVDGLMRKEPYAEISEQLGICRSLAHAEGQRALDKLRKILETGDTTPSVELPDDG